MHYLPEKKGALSFSGGKALTAAAVLTALITFMVYIPALRNGFVDWDDQAYVYENTLIRSIDSEFFKYIFTTPVHANWHPLTVLSYAVDYSIWGLNPWGYHLVNIFFHAINTSLVFILTYALVRTAGKQKTGSGLFLFVAGVFTALLFGLHPLHVESVAWVSERKDVLSAFFFLLSILFYLKYASPDSSKKVLYYSGALFSFILAILSKPMAITLPVVLLILDFYPLERLTVKVTDLRNLVVEKAPFFIVTVISAFLTIWAQKKALIPLASVPVFLRISIALRAFVFYLYKMLLPLGLSPYYPYDYNPHPSIKDFFNYEYSGSFALLAVATIFCVITAKRHKFFLAAWAYYIVTLIPVSGIVQVGGQAAADRYAYLPSLGPFMLAGAGAGYLISRCKTQVRIFCLAVIMVLFAVLAILTVRQTSVWKDTLSLWSRTIDIYPDSIPVVHLNRGKEYMKRGDYKKSIEDFDIAIRLVPGYTEAYLSRGMCYGLSGQPEKAIPDFTMAIELNPKDPNPYHNRGVAYLNSGEFTKAADDIKKSIELAPDSGVARLNLGLAYLKLGKKDLAIENFKKANELGVKQAREYLDKIN